MADSFDPILQLILMTYASDPEQWGAPNLNNNNTWIAQAIAGTNSLTVTSSTYTLSNTQNAANEARRRIQVISTSGTQTVNCQVIIPSGQEGWWLFYNSGVSGGFTMSVGINGGNTVDLPYLRRTIIRTDGTTTYSREPRLDQINAPTALVNMNSQTISGLAAPTVSGQAATKGYVDAQTTTSVNNLPAPTGNLSMASYRIINTGAPLNANDVTTLQYVQGYVAGALAAATLSSTVTGNANTVLAGPTSGAAAQVTFRSIVLADLTSQGIMPIQWSITTASGAATAGNGYLVNTAAAAITYTMPTSPTAGDQVAFSDMTGSFSTNALTVSAATIMGLAGPMTVNTANAGFILVYSNSTYGWRIS